MIAVKATLPTLGQRSAEISPCGRYRYRLTRTWNTARPALGWVMLNPSTADAAVDDPTIRRCMAFARAAGFGGITVANLFAWRATQPADLLEVDDPFGYPRNAVVLATLFAEHDTVVAAWGPKHGEIIRRRLREQPNIDRIPDDGREVLAMAKHSGSNLVCLGVTKDGSPRHPLYVASAQPFIPWERPS